jgi:hypothetical protein
MDRYENPFEERPKALDLPVLDENFYKKLWEETLKLTRDKPYVDGGVRV